MGVASVDRTTVPPQIFIGSALAPHEQESATRSTFEGADPAGYALAANIARRHLSKGQQAMIVAKASLSRNEIDHARAEVRSRMLAVNPEPDGSIPQ